MKLLRIELSDAFRTLHMSRTQIFHLAKSLSQCIPTHIGNSFLEKQEHSLHCFYQIERNKIDKKIIALKIKQKNDSIKNISKIKYMKLNSSGTQTIRLP